MEAISDAAGRYLQVGRSRESITVQAALLTPAATSTGQTAPARVRVGGNVLPPRKPRNAMPASPKSMRCAGIEGIVPIDGIHP